MSIAEQLEAEVKKLTAEKVSIQCVVLNEVDFKELTGFDANFVSDFGCFLGIPIRLGGRTHVRPTLHFRLKAQKREGQTDV